MGWVLVVPCWFWVSLCHYGGDSRFGSIGGISATWRVHKSGGTYLEGTCYMVPSLSHRSHRSSCHTPFLLSFVIQGVWVDGQSARFLIITSLLQKDKAGQLASMIKHKKERKKLTGAQTTVHVWAHVACKVVRLNHGLWRRCCGSCGCVGVSGNRVEVVGGQEASWRMQTKVHNSGKMFVM